MQEQFGALSAFITSPQLSLDDPIESKDEIADGIPIRIYKAKDATSIKLPIVVYYHGGGYVLGDLDTEDPWCRCLAKNTPCIVISVGYRLGPNFKMPAMIDDSLAAYKWVCRPPYPLVSYYANTEAHRYMLMLRDLEVLNPGSSPLAHPLAAGSLLLSQTLFSKKVISVTFREL